MRKIMKKAAVLFCTVIFIAAMLIGCTNSGTKSEGGSGKGKEGGKKRIGISLVYKGDEWCAAVDEELKKQAKDFGYEVNIQDGNLDNETQVKQIENFITQQYDLIAVDPASPEGIVPALEKAAQAGIPIVVFDAPTTYKDIISYVSWDSYETGKLIGDYLHDVIKKDYNGKANIALLTMASPIQIGERIKGVKDALKDLDITYVAEQEYEGNREKAANIITNIKEKIDFVVAGQDNGAWGAVSALEALNNKTTKVYSMGAYGSEPFDALKANNTDYKGTVAVSPNKLVNATYEVIKQYFAGDKDIKKEVNIDLDLVTTDNINEYLKNNK